jgi:hypothetical protein
MTNYRESSRREARRKRALVRLVDHQRAQALGERVNLALRNARSAISDKRFVDLLRSHGIQNVPVPLAPASGRSALSPPYNLAEASLEFAIVWSFFFPLFANTAIAEYLRNGRPGLVSELKDTFIALVIEGPFPHMMSGHTGRRHQGEYRSSHERL